MSERLDLTPEQFAKWKADMAKRQAEYEARRRQHDEEYQASHTGAAAQAEPAHASA